MRTEHFDAIVIGSGVAGFHAASRLIKEGVSSVALLTEGKDMGTSRNTGSDKQTYYKLSLAGNEGDSVLGMAETLFAGGAVNGDNALCEAASSARCFFELVSLGVPFPTNEYGEFVGYKTDHDPFSRATSVGPYTSKKMTEVLEAEALRTGVRLFDRMKAVSLLTGEQGIVGALALDLSVTDRAEFVAFESPAVVLATGGEAGLYRDSVYPVSQTGSSSLALNAGAAFANLSEWQYGIASTDFRWNVSGSYMQVLPRFLSVDGEGVEREFLAGAFSSDAGMLRRVFLKGYEWPFDARKTEGSSAVDLLVYRETVLLGRQVYLDFTKNPQGLPEDLSGLDPTVFSYLQRSGALGKTPIERLSQMNPAAAALYREHGIDLAKEPLRVAVCAQHCNGGVAVDADWRSTVPGLYAAGEAAGDHGIFRPGGSALNACMVGSLRAAAAIAAEKRDHDLGGFEKAAQKALAEAEGFLKATHGSGENLCSVRNGLRARMSRDFAFLRVLPEMRASFAELSEMAETPEKILRWQDPAEVPALFAALDLLAMAQAVSFAMLGAAERYGSRGSALITERPVADLAALSPLPENEAGRGEILSVGKSPESGELWAKAAPVRPIPERDLWFESVWKKK